MSIEEAAQELHSRFEALLKEASRNEITLKKFQVFELELMNAKTLGDLLDILLNNNRPEFGWDIVTLTLVDPEYEIQRLLELSGFILSEHPELNFIASDDALENIYHQQLFPISGLYDDDDHEPLFSAGIKNPEDLWLLPLSRSHHLVGSYNIGKLTSDNSNENTATDFLQHLAAIISVSLEISITRERLQYLGLIDPLTGVNNRRFFDQRLIEEVTTVTRENADISCLFIDIDHFKNINDNYGHRTGDNILKEVAQIIRELVRSTDVVARYGGEEFIVLLSHKSKEKATEIAERIRETVEKKTFTGSQNENITVTISIGINTLKSDQHEGNTDEVASSFVEYADRALYQAKNNGRNRVEIYSGN
jgi:two-component system cell cycle response regulator